MAGTREGERGRERQVMTKDENFNKVDSNMYNTKGGVGGWKWCEYSN